MNSSILLFDPFKIIFFSYTKHKTAVMADFDAIYADRIEEGSAILEEANAALLPDPVIFRGAGNITV